MNGIKEWSAILCLAALASCMLEMIIPSGRMEKIMRFVLGGFTVRYDFSHFEFGFSLS